MTVNQPEGKTDVPLQQNAMPSQMVNVNVNTFVQQKEVKRTYHNHLCNCCAAGCGVCMLSFCCNYQALFANARTKYDGSNYCLNLCCGSSVLMRNIIREGYNIKGDCCGDCMVTTFCGPCAAIQTYAEVEERGPVRQAM